MSSYRRTPFQEKIDQGITHLWLIPFLMGIGLLISSITGASPITNNISDEVSSARSALSAGEIDHRLSRAIEELESRDLTRGNGALIFDSPKYDYARIYADLLAYRDQARGLAMTDPSTIEHQAQMSNIHDRLTQVQNCWGIMYFFDLWTTGMSAVSFIAIVPVVFLSNRIESILRRRRNSHYWRQFNNGATAQ
jgi:hypothetical protein